MLRLSQMQRKGLQPLATAAFSAKIPQNHNLQGMIEWYQRNGHKFATTDPLGLQQ